MSSLSAKESNWKLYESHNKNIRIRWFLRKRGRYPCKFAAIQSSFQSEWCENFPRKLLPQEKNRFLKKSAKNLKVLNSNQRSNLFDEIISSFQVCAYCKNKRVIRKEKKTNSRENLHVYIEWVNVLRELLPNENISKNLSFFFYLVSEVSVLIWNIDDPFLESLFVITTKNCWILKLSMWKCTKFAQLTLNGKCTTL